MPRPNSLRALAQALKNKDTTSSELVNSGLACARQSESVFISLDEGLANFAAIIDEARSKGQALPALAGIPISIKDLFNIRNQKTLAGSKVLDALGQPESDDASVIAALREAGLLFLGRTNMSEFAFSGMGKNPHYGTPLSIWDRACRRLPGGSSSGSAVSVAEGIVTATVGSDTAGSCRIPAAFNGIVGVKPSYGRLSLKGVYPLSPSSDAPGPLANDVDSCFLLDGLMSGNISPREPLPTLTPRSIDSIRILVPQSQVLDDLDEEVSDAFDLSLQVLRDAGASIDYSAMSSIDDAVDLFANRAVVLHEAYHQHRYLLEKYGDLYDPFVYQRLLGGAQISDAQQLARYREKARVVEQFNQQFRTSNADVLLYPTVACIPPKISDTEGMENARRVNLQCLRNTATVNYFDGCSISLPCHKKGTAPIGLMLSSIHGDDDKLFIIASAIEKSLRQIRQ